MTGGAPPKPTKRGPKPRKPIKRSRLAYTKAGECPKCGGPRVNSIGAFHKRTCPDYEAPRRPNRIRQTPKGKAKHKADLAWSKAVRAKGPCIARNERLFVVTGVDTITKKIELSQIHPPCDTITAAHVMRRGYLATRHDIENGEPLCFTAHDFFTRHPDEWEAFIRRHLGEERYEALRKKAMAGPKAES